ncbi:hypothetical protein MMC31_002991 [Peltigera leucophlebia]|nr:hypothetical protein [Peltigera leucophlebia]
MKFVHVPNASRGLSTPGSSPKFNPRKFPGSQEKSQDEQEHYRNIKNPHNNGRHLKELKMVISMLEVQGNLLGKLAAKENTLKGPGGAAADLDVRKMETVEAVMVNLTNMPLTTKARLIEQ